MPYYSRPIGTKYPPIAFVFNREIITDLLRNEMGFDGIVLSDWMLITDSYTFGEYAPARAWRTEHLSELERVAMILDASVDEFGGKSRPELIVQLVDEGQVPESRLDEPCRRLWAEKPVGEV